MDAITLTSSLSHFAFVLCVCKYKLMRRRFDDETHANLFFCSSNSEISLCLCLDCAYSATFMRNGIKCTCICCVRNESGLTTIALLWLCFVRNNKTLSESKLFFTYSSIKLNEIHMPT